jgi:hypothetical protein
MYTPVLHLRYGQSIAALSVALAAALIVSLPAAAFNSGFTQPKRVFAHTAAPFQTMATDDAGKVHIATDKGSSGVWYVTNASGSWQECQVSSGSDRRPSIALEGNVAHIAFARFSDGQEGIYTASSNQAAPSSGCGWAITKRWSGSGYQPAMAAYGSQLSIAFRTADKKLKFIKGAASDPSWSIKETIDAKCCTSAVAIDVTTSGGARVAYGDGASKADGLKFGVRTSKGWKKSKAFGGRVKHVAMVLDKNPGVFTPPSNGPKIAFVVKKKGLYFGTKGNAGAAGGWGIRSLGKRFAPPDIQHFPSNRTVIVAGNKGNLFRIRTSGAIWVAEKLSGGGTDGNPQVYRDHITFTRNAGNKGIYYSRPK